MKIEIKSTFDIFKFPEDTKGAKTHMIGFPVYSGQEFIAVYHKLLSMGYRKLKERPGINNDAMLSKPTRTICLEIGLSDRFFDFHRTNPFITCVEDRIEEPGLHWKSNGYITLHSSEALLKAKDPIIIEPQEVAEIASGLITMKQAVVRTREKLKQRRENWEENLRLNE